MSPPWVASLLSGSSGPMKGRGCSRIFTRASIVAASCGPRLPDAHKDADSGRRTHSAKQQVVRIDREPGWPLPAEVSRTFAKKIAPPSRMRAVLLSDYGSGLVTPALAATVGPRSETVAPSSDPRAHGQPVIVCQYTGHHVHAE